MRRNRNTIWESLFDESTEGPSVTLQLPREVAEQLMSVLGASLEVDDAGGGDDFGFDADPSGGDDMDVDIPFGDIDDAGGDEMPFGSDDDMMAAGDDSDDEPAPPPKKKAPPKKDGGDKKKEPKKDDDDGEDKPKESVSESVRRLGAYALRGRR